MATKYTSIVDALNANSLDSSYAARANYAANAGINGYTGTAAQNNKLLSMYQADPSSITARNAAKEPIIGPSGTMDAAYANAQNDAAYQAALAARNATGNVAPSQQQNQYSINSRYWDPVTQSYINNSQSMNQPAWTNVNAMNQDVGLMIDRGQANRIYNDATRAQGVADRAAWEQTANQSYDQIRANQSSVLQAMRQQQAQAILNGAARGINAATQLNAILGMNDQNAAVMRDMRSQQAQTYLDENAQIARNVRDALEYTEANRQALANLSRDKYDIDNQALQAWMTAQADLAGQQIAGGSNMYAADQALTGTKYASDSELQGVKYNADQNYAGNVYTADKNYAGNVYTADSNERSSLGVAQINKDAQVASTQIAQGNTPSTATTTAAAKPASSSSSSSSGSSSSGSSSSSSSSASSSGTYPKVTNAQIKAMGSDFSTGSIVDALKTIGVGSSYTNRAKIAAANGISNYTGTAAQNTKLLSLIKAGNLKKP